ncbi:3789_t:CDS:1, partial [Scutellospora calospora]
MSTNLTEEQPEKNLQLINKIAANNNQLNLEENISLDFFNNIVTELYNQIIEDRSKGKDTELIVEAWDQFLVKKQMNSDKIINWCLDNQINNM